MVTIRESKNALIAGTPKSKVTLVYEANPGWIRQRGQELWNAGCDVRVKVHREFYTYLDYIIVSRVHPDEPIQAIVDWYHAQKAAKRRYRTALQRMTRHVAAETGRSVGEVRTKFKELQIPGLDFRQ